jgi:amino acid transporter
MSQDRVFLREATGLVREMSVADSLYINLFNVQFGLGLALYLLTGPVLFPGGNLIIGIILGMIGGLFTAASWALISIVMPRSGGDYVYTSRCIHPAVAFACDILGWVGISFLWAAINSNLVATFALPSFLTLVGSMTNNASVLSAAQAVATPLWSFIIGAVILIFIAWSLMIGLKRGYLRFQRVVIVLAMLMIFIAIGLLATHTHADFIAAFNSYSANYGSPDYNGVISTAKAQGYNIPQTTTAATFGLLPIAWWTFAYPYFSGVLGGEVKRPKRNALWGMIGSVLISGICMIIITWQMENVIGYDFLGSISYISTSSSYKLPAAPYLHFLVGLLTNNVIVLILIGVGFTCWMLATPATSILAVSRQTLAWSFDRLAPGVFGEVSDKYHTPVKNLLIVLAIDLGVLAIYTLYSTYFATFAAVFLNVTSWSLVAISCIVIPFRKTTKPVYEASPAKYEVAKIPLITLCGIGYLVFLMLMVYYYLSIPALGAINDPSAIIMVAAFVAGLIGFYLIRAYRRKQGIDIDLCYKSLPPE